MDALIQKLERSVARMGDVHNESLNDSAKKQGTSLDPPLYDCRTLFSMFSGSDSSKRVVDIDKIWYDAQMKLTVNHIKDNDDQAGVVNNKKLQRIKNHSRYVRKVASTNELVLEHVARQRSVIKRASSHPSLRLTQQQTRPATTTNNGRISTASNFNTPISYHGFLATELRKASGQSSMSPPSADQSIGILKEMYEIR